MDAVASDRAQVELLPVPCLVVLVGPSGSGKSTWAAEHFSESEIVSSDRLRGIVGRGEDDLDATDDAFALLDAIVDHRLRRGLSTVIDALGLDAARRQIALEQARARGMPCVAVAFDVDSEECRARNRERPRPVPAPALKQQLARWSEARASLPTEGFDRVLEPVAVRQVPERFRTAAPLTARQRDDPVGVRFGLQVGAFPWPDIATGLGATAAAAEAAGFDSIWLMDHVRQIPQVGRDWDPLLECYTALAWLAARSTTLRLGALVTPVTFRHIGILAKSIATIDVLSGGRAVCGLGIGWYAREHQAYGIAFPPVAERYALLEDALQALPRLWGPGAKPWSGRVLDLAETIGYPRPLQDRVPILVGGGGEERTLRLAARYADAVNVMGTVDVVARKVEVLRRHCIDAERDPDDVAMTHLAPVLVGADRHDLERIIDTHRPRGVDPSVFAALTNAGTVDDHIGRVRELVDAGVSEVMVSLVDLGSDEAPFERFAAVIDAFRTG